LNEEISYKVIKLIEQNPALSQRALARELGVSLGKTNYCIRALMDRGWVKARNLKNNKNKLAYSYLLTPKGLEKKTRITARFLKQRMNEYEALKQEIESLRKEVSQSPPSADDNSTHMEKEPS